MKIDLNLETDDTEANDTETAGTAAVICRHCGARVGDSVADPMNHALRNERPSTAAGPGVHADPAAFVDRAILLRQTFCPGCLTLLTTEIVPDGEPSYRNWSLT